jgi:tripartite-type tricarboxylate transporter receptor subunit TctC
MVETRDFSSLLAVTERIQYHATKMESALYSYEDIKYKIARRVDKEDLTDEEFRNYVRDRVKKWNDDE